MLGISANEPNILIFNRDNATLQQKFVLDEVPIFVGWSTAYKTIIAATKDAIRSFNLGSNLIEDPLYQFVNPNSSSGLMVIAQKGTPTLSVLDSKDGQPLELTFQTRLLDPTFPRFPGLSQACLGDDGTLYVGSGNVIQGWNVKTGQRSHNLQIKSEVLFVKVNGPRMVVGSIGNLGQKHLTVVNLEKKSMVEHEWVENSSLLCSRNKIFVGSKSGISAMDPESGMMSKLFPCNDLRLWDCSEDGDRMVIVQEGSIHFIRGLNSKFEEDMRRIDWATVAEGCRMSPDGKLVSTASKGHLVRIWNIAGEIKVVTQVQLESRLEAEWVNNNQFVLWHDVSITCYSVNGGKILWEHKLQNVLEIEDCVTDGAHMLPEDQKLIELKRGSKRQRMIWRVQHLIERQDRDDAQICNDFIALCSAQTLSKSEFLDIVGKILQNPSPDLIAVTLLSS